MKRTTIYLEPELEVLLKLEMLKQGRPMAEIVREAVHAYVTREPRRIPPGAGSFASGRRDTASDMDAALAETGFGGETRRTAKRPKSATSRNRK